MDISTKINAFVQGLKIQTKIHHWLDKILVSHIVSEEFVNYLLEGLKLFKIILYIYLYILQER